MAVDLNVAQRYAAALFRRALREGVLGALAEEARALLSLGRDENLRRFMEAPQISVAKKRALVEKALAGSISSQLDEFILLLIDKGRIDHLQDALEMFLAMEEEHRGVFPAEVVTATPLDEDERQALQRALEAHTGHKLKIAFTVDPDVLGGVVFHHRDELLDTSLRSGLRGLRDQIAQVRVH